jgi:hypothetical protein
MPAIPLRGDRSAWNAGSYRTLHTNDIDASASAIHHTIGTSASQAAPGDHTHEVYDLGSDASSYGQLLTSDGAGFSNWEWLANHSHAGINAGDGGQLSWDNIWLDAVHDHSGSAQGGKFTINSLSSGAVVAGYVLTSDGSGSAVWSAPSSTITTLNSIPNVYVPAPNDGDILTWNAASGSWIAYRAVDWRVTLTQDTSTDDSDKIFTVPAGTEWQILWVWVEYTSSATAGVRQLEIQLQDGSSNTIGQFQTGVTQSEGITYKYFFGIGVPDLTVVRDGNNVTTPLPAGTFLSAGQRIRVWDNNGVDASADDMVIRLQYATRTLSIEDFNPPTATTNSTQGQTSENITLAQNKVLSINNTSQLQASDKAVLAGRFGVLVIQNGDQVQTSDNTILYFVNVPSINNSVQAQTSDTVALTQYHILGMHNASMRMVSDKPVLSIIQHYSVITNNTQQTQTSENTGLIFYVGIIVHDSTQAQASENIILISDIIILSINNTSQAQSSEGVLIITNIFILTIRNSTQSITSDRIPVNNKFILTVNNSTQATTSDNITALTFYQKALTVNNANNKLITSSVTLYSP